MEPIVLELSKKICYVIYNNQLLINVPKKKLDKTIEALSSGTSLGKVEVFTMDGRFNMRYAAKESHIYFSDGNIPNKKIYYENSNDKQAIVEWLTPYLEQNGFNHSEQTVSGSKLLMRGLGSVVTVLFIFGILYWAEGSSTRNLSAKSKMFVSIANALGTELILIIGGVCLLAAIIYTVRVVKKGDVYLTYSK